MPEADRLQISSLPGGLHATYVVTIPAELPV
jgi:hypothetical protein